MLSYLIILLTPSAFFNLDSLLAPPCGQFIKKLLPQEKLDGSTRIHLQARFLNSGIYFIQFETAAEKYTERILLLH